jgi:nonsense-mediated mRNA decay protein 3
MSEVEPDRMAAEFCVVCGRTDQPLADGVCPDCFAKRTSLVSVAQHPKVVICPTCGARLVGRHWEGSGSPTMLGPTDLLPFLRPHEEVAIRRVAWEEKGANPLVRDIKGQVSVRFRGTEQVVPVHFSVQIEHRTCTDCSRRSGHYYTSILQLRGDGTGRHESARDLRARLARVWDTALKECRADWHHALAFKEERPEGWDMFLSDTLVARALSRWMKTRFHADLKESATLWGRKDGRDVYRVTFCLRIPARPADEIERPGAREADAVRPTGPARPRVQR